MKITAKKKIKTQVNVRMTENELELIYSTLIARSQQVKTCHLDHSECDCIEIQKMIDNIYSSRIPF